MTSREVKEIAYKLGEGAVRDRRPWPFFRRAGGLSPPGRVAGMPVGDLLRLPVSRGGRRLRE